VNSGPDGLAEGRGRLLVLAFLALIAGAASGLQGAVFRLALERADRFRDSVVAWAHGEALVGFLLIMSVAAAATALAAWLVRRFSPDATGSGIPVVEAELQKEQPEAPLRLAGVGVADWSSLRDLLRQLVPRRSHQSDGIGRGWNGRILHCRGACSRYGDYPGH
jgi:hypothetical protein